MSGRQLIDRVALIMAIRDHGIRGQGDNVSAVVALIQEAPAIEEIDDREWHCPGEEAEHWEKRRFTTDDGTVMVECGYCGLTTEIDQEGNVIDCT